MHTRDHFFMSLVRQSLEEAIPRRGYPVGGIQSLVLGEHAERYYRFDDITTSLMHALLASASAGGFDDCFSCTTFLKGEWSQMIGSLPFHR